MGRLVCWLIGHDWFPTPLAREWMPATSVCLRCPATTITMPYGDCIGGHPIVDHYDFTGKEHPLPREVCKTVWPA